MKGFNIYLMGNMAFVRITKGQMLCIGSKAEVDSADGKRLVEMIQEAIAMSEFRSIESCKDRSIN